jgi:hypothetical protein
LGNLVFTFNVKFPFTLSLVCLALIAVGLLARQWQRTFVLAWTGLLLATFLNPLAATFLTDHFIPTNIYWRMFYLMPFPLVVGVAGVTFSNTKIARGLAWGAFFIAAALYLAVSYQQGFIDPALKLPVKNLDIAQRIVNNAPPGLMLAPANLSGPVTIISANYPQLITMKIAVDYWLIPQGQAPEAALRAAASGFIQGNSQDFQSFMELVTKYPQIQSIVLSPKAWADENVQKFLQQQGFRQTKKIGGYQITWKNP